MPDKIIEKKLPFNGIIHTYPKLKTDLNLHRNKKCVVYLAYELNGISLSINLYKDISIIVSDWNGQIIDLNSTEAIAIKAKNLLALYQSELFLFLKGLKIDEIQMFFVDQPGFPLVDTILNPSRFSSPGAISEIFGKFLNFYPMMTELLLDDSVIKAIVHKIGMYKQKLIIKPSRFVQSVDSSQPDPDYLLIN